TMLYFTLERQPLQLGLLKDGDWFGIATMAIGLAALQAVLEEGNKDDWFGSPFIVKLAIVAAIGLSVFVANELLIDKPLVRLRLLTQRSFGFGTVSAIFLGFALFGSVYLLPAYLGEVQHYNAEQIGSVMAWTGLPQLVLIPLVPKLMQRFDIRYMAFAGMSLFAISSFMNTRMSLDYSGDQFLLPNIVRAAGQALTLAPLSALSLGSVAPQDAAAASGISNMMRNLGGAIGTAMLATIVTRREQFHSNIIGQAVDLGRDAVRSRVAEMTNYFLAHGGMVDPTAARHQALIALGNEVKRQALVMGFSDTFAVIGFVLVLAGFAVLLTGKPKAAPLGGGH
ncbi:MAG: MFS transporter, partial [Bradyrhizobium sp.]